MKLKIAIPIAILLLCAFTGIERFNGYRDISNSSFATGEHLEFRVHVGWINAGRSTMVISDSIYSLNQRPCYKIAVTGETSGVFELFIKVRDEWGTFLDTTAIVPHQFYRNIEEGKYRKYEIVDFDHSQDSAIVSKLDKHTRKLKEKLKFGIDNDSQDLISGYYYLRTLDYDQYEKGDIISIPAFFDDEKYDFEVKYLGRDKVKTKIGKIYGVLLAPIMPDNDLFVGEDAIKVWLSDDANKIPLKVKAKMWVGAVEIDITDAKNLRSPLAKIK